MIKKVYIVLFLFLLSLFSFSQQNYTLSGTLTDSADGETVIGAAVYVKSLQKGAVANVYGFYSLTLPAGEYEVQFSFISYETYTVTIKLDKNIVLDYKFKSVETQLKEVIVSAEASKEKEAVRSTQMGMITLPMDQIKQLPYIGGEVDVIKIMQLMPGIKRGGEGQTGMFVRGGDADQNLILVDEATVYNVAHLFGFFSVFNNDALKDVIMYKGGFPANYGGRLSAVMDVRMKEGDMNKYKVDAGIGLLSSRATVQGPIIKDKASFIVSGRRTYIDQVFKVASGGKNVLPYFFYDVNGKLNWKVTDRDRLFLSFYKGDDVLRFSEKSDSALLNFGFYLGNITSTVRWNHLYKNPKLFSNTSLIYTRFRYDIHGSFGENSVLIRSKIQDIGMKADYNYYKSHDNHFSYGGAFTTHVFKPNVVGVTGELTNLLQAQEGKNIPMQEFGLYGLNDRQLNTRWKINYGLRLSIALVSNRNYGGIEPRLAFTYLLNETSSFKMGYSHMVQYMHLVSSSSIALPTDLWYPVTDKVQPQNAHQIAFGYTKNFEKKKLMFVAETYYKLMNNLIEYREGASIILNDNFEKEIVSGTGKAYGLELFLQRSSGRLTGWVGYTLSYATRQFNSLNKGAEYYAKYDRRHDISLVGSYDISKRWSFSAVWVYATGTRFTPVVGNYFMPNASLSSVDILPIYTDKNAIKLPASHRLDLNFVLHSKPKKHWKNWKSEWHFGCYNFYNRAQPYRVEIVSTSTGGYKYQAVGLFGFIPSVAFNFSF